MLFFKNKKKSILSRLLTALIIVILIFGLIFTFYIAESRFFALGKILYPSYVASEKLINILKYNYFKIRNIDETEYPLNGHNKETIVYCDYYTWHNEEHWQRGHSNIPFLGFYNSSDRDVIDQHIEWAKEFGINVFKVEYIPQFDDSIKGSILNADMQGTKICLMYDSMLRFESIGYKEPPYDFNNLDISQTFLDDMDHIANKYFGNENYFKIEGRPVLWVYVVRDFTGDFKKTIETARLNLAKKGYDVYLVADVVFWNYRFDKIGPFDALSCYSAYAGRPTNTAEFAERLKFLYMVWRTVAFITGKDFIPAAIPAYDDTCLSNERISVPPLEGSGEDFRYQLEVISNFLDPVNIAPYLRQVKIATFNEHQEGSSVEPSHEWGFERIEQIPAVFGY